MNTQFEDTVDANSRSQKDENSGEDQSRGFWSGCATVIVEISGVFHLMRAQIIIVGISIFLLSYEQTVDEYRALFANVFDAVYPERIFSAIFTLIFSVLTLILLFPFTIWFTGRWLADRESDGSYIEQDDDQRGYRKDEKVGGKLKRWLPRTLAILPLFTVSYVSWKAGQKIGDINFYIAALVCILASVAWLYVFVSRTKHKVFNFISDILGKSFNDLRLWFLMFLVLNLVLILLLPVKAPQFLGVITYGLGFFIVVLVFATFLTWGHMRTGVPYMILLGAWAALLAGFNLTNNHHIEPVVVAEENSSVKQPDYLDVAFEAWSERKQRETTGDGEVPVFVVAAAGGGIYAAQNAAFVLAKLDDSLGTQGCGEFSKHVFAVSGISGGSVGAALHNVMLSEQIGNNSEVRDCSTEEHRLEPKLSRILNEDLLAPVVANFATLDYPQRLLPSWLISFPDRGTALQEAILAAAIKENSATEKFLKSPASTLWRANAGLPALVLNSAELNTGRTVASAPFKLRTSTSTSIQTSSFPEEEATFREILATAPAGKIYEPLSKCSDKLVELRNTDAFKQDRDLSLIQAAVMSARFPYASPAGSIVRLTTSNGCSDVEDKKGKIFAAETQYIDGGYVESSGTEQALKIVKKLQDYSVNRCKSGEEVSNKENYWCRIKVHLIAINLKTASPTSNASYGLVLTPPMGLLKTWSQRSKSSTEAAEDYFETRSEANNIGNFYPIDPFDKEKVIPLGWRLSQQTSEKLSELICTGGAATKMEELLGLVTNEETYTLSCGQS